MMCRFPTIIVLSMLGAAAHAQPLDQPPTTPGNPTVTVHSPTFAVVQWQRSRDDRGAVAGYEVLRDEVSLGVVDALSYVDRELAPGRGYNYVILAVDNAGQRSLRATVRAETPDAIPSPPTGVRAEIYSRTAAELFWDRSGVFAERYEIKRDGVVVATTDGTGYFDDTLTAARPYLFEVIALNRQGERSAPVRLFVDTGTLGDGGGPAAPGGLRAAVYSRTAAEVFWDRPAAFGLVHEVRRDGVRLTVTDGTSWFDDTLAGGTSYTYTIIAIAPDGRRSAGSEVTLTTLGAPPPGGGGSVLDADTAEAILQEVASIANADFFPQFLPIVDEEHDEMYALWVPGSTASSDSYALIEGTADDPSDGGPSSNGGRYTCLAGGSAALPTINAGEEGNGFVIRFEQCVTVSDTLGATVTLDGEAQVLPAGRGGFEFQRYTSFTVHGDALELAIDGELNEGVTGRGGTSLGDVETVVSSYTRTTPDGESAMIGDYRSLLSVNVSGSGVGPRTASAEIGFVAATPETAGQTLSVDIDLDYDGTGVPPEGRIDQWNSGRIVVEAADGSRIWAEPIADDPTTLRIVVGDVTLERPWAEGYQIDCVGLLSGCR